mmetsp:Transcript_12962/g.26486  ORF Transcript_12962/g.26486 Transcript_12962/m.26486 type:complete len:418 (+) Transcript_12962:31-1284(+)
MCQLLGMNAARPTDFSFSFKGFKCRGGATDKHADGWGLGAYQGKGLRTFIDPNPSCSSPIASLMCNLPIKTHNMIAHIRLATIGETCTENVHPFQRELWGINWCFAHNGDLPHFSGGRRPVLGRAFKMGLRPSTPFSPTTPPQPPTATTEGKGVSESGGGSPSCPEPPTPPSPTLRINFNQPSPSKSTTTSNGRRFFNPVGTTDSEAVFVEIMNAIALHFDVTDGLPTTQDLHDFVKVMCVEIVEGGNDYAMKGGGEEQLPIFNFLLCCGEGVQFAFSYPGKRPGSNVWNGLNYLIRKPPFKHASLVDCDVNIDFADVTNEDDQVAVIATQPLTSDENWVEMKKGELILFEYGTAYSSSNKCTLSDSMSWEVEDVASLQNDCVCNTPFTSPSRNPEKNPERRRSKSVGSYVEAGACT